ncbi:MAG: TrmH family RNA methyltransferase, partial [Flavobacteriaceae bacterium]
GNLGAIFRSADAAHIDAVIITEPIADLYNPNCLRSSLGCSLSIPSIVCTNEELQVFFEENHVRSYAATLQNSNNYLEENYTRATAFIVGSEAKGLRAFWRENASQNVVIPMRGAIDSMNVSVASSILLFEAIRQRISL